MSANVQKYSSHNPQYSPFHDLNTKYHVENDHWFFNPQTDSKNLNFIFRRVPNPDRFKVDHHGHGFNIMGFHQLFMVFEDSEKSHI